MGNGWRKLAGSGRKIKGLEQAWLWLRTTYWKFHDLWRRHVPCIPQLDGAVIWCRGNQRMAAFSVSNTTGSNFCWVASQFLPFWTFIVWWRHTKHLQGKNVILHFAAFCHCCFHHKWLNSCSAQQKWYRRRSDLLDSARCTLVIVNTYPLFTCFIRWMGLSTFGIKASGRVKHRVSMSNSRLIVSYGRLKFTSLAKRKLYPTYLKGSSLNVTETLVLLSYMYCCKDIASLTVQFAENCTALIVLKNLKVG